VRFSGRHSVTRFDEERFYMPRLTAALTAAAVVLMAAGLAAQAKPSLAGKWVMDPASAPAPPPGGGGRGGGRGGGLGQEMTITQDATTLTIDYMGGGQNPAPVKLV
jgi:Spy/CpxP family protein refolding chaperone